MHALTLNVPPLIVTPLAGRTLLKAVEDSVMNSENRANPISVGVEDGARLIGVARSAMYDYIGRGEIPTFKLGRRRLILFKSLEAFVSRQAQENSR